MSKSDPEPANALYPIVVGKPIVVSIIGIVVILGTLPVLMLVLAVT